MTIRGLGKITPIQGDVIRLLGYRINRAGITNDISAEERTQIQQQALQNLRDATGKNFGLDAGKWHRYLSRWNVEYRHPYAFEAVKHFMKSALADSKPPV